MSTEHGMASGVPFDSLDTASLPTEEGYAIWRESLSPLFHARLANESASHCKARIDSYDLQHLLLARSEFPESLYERGMHHAADGGADPLLVQLYMRGGYQGHNGHRPVTVNQGDISLLDMADPLATRAQASTVLSLVIPRELVRDAGKLPCGAVLPAASPMAAILGNHLLTVWRQLAHASLEALGPVNETLVATTVAAFRGLRQDPEQALAGLPEQARREAVCAYILRCLGQDDLSPEHLCRQFGFSRAGLYRLFEPLGGVAGFIREARLRRCYDELARPGALGRPRRVIDVAMRWGFNSQSHFTRLFRRTFDVLPGDLLAASEEASRASTDDRSSASTSRPALRQWLARLCREPVER